MGARGFSALLRSLFSPLSMSRPRHIAPFVTILFFDPTFTALPGRIDNLLAGSGRGLRVGLGALVCLHHDHSKSEPMLPFQVTPQNEASELANDMRSLGVQPHDEFAMGLLQRTRAASSGLVSRERKSWLKSTGTPDYWRLSEPERRKVLAVLASTGAKFAVSRNAAPQPP